MSEQNRVVAHFTDGSVVHGTTLDFMVNRPAFHLKPVGEGSPKKILCASLKAVFFVKEYSGHPSREDVRGFIAGPTENKHGKKIAVRFNDGEFLCGYTLSYTPDRDGFMLFPADDGSNNTRVYVIRAGTVEVKAGPAAEILAEKVLKSLEAAS